MQTLMESIKAALKSATAGAVQGVSNGSIYLKAPVQTWTQAQNPVAAEILSYLDSFDMAMLGAPGYYNLSDVGPVPIITCAELGLPLMWSIDPNNWSVESENNLVSTLDVPCTRAEPGAVMSSQELYDGTPGFASAFPNGPTQMVFGLLQAAMKRPPIVPIPPTTQYGPGPLVYVADGYSFRNSAMGLQWFNTGVPAS